jgi:hypothetical protein
MYIGRGARNHRSAACAARGDAPAFTRGSTRRDGAAMAATGSIGLAIAVPANIAFSLAMALSGRLRAFGDGAAAFGLVARLANATESK